MNEDISPWVFFDNNILTPEIKYSKNSIDEEPEDGYGSSNDYKFR